MKVPLCNDCVYFVKGSARCNKFELLDETYNGYWPSDALGNRLDEYRCGMEGKYFLAQKKKRPAFTSFLSHLTHKLFGG